MKIYVVLLKNWKHMRASGVADGHLTIDITEFVFYDMAGSVMWLELQQRIKYFYVQMLESIFGKSNLCDWNLIKQ